MKKLLTFVFAVILSTLFITGCNMGANQTPQQSADPEQQLSQAEPTPSSKPAVNQQAETPSNSVNTTNFIGEEKAKQIALNRAGISADGVIFDRIELDRDDGVWQYEVDFRKGATEYDVDIKADDGTILSYESEYDND